MNDTQTAVPIPPAAGAQPVSTGPNAAVRAAGAKVAPHVVAAAGNPGVRRPVQPGQAVAGAQGTIRPAHQPTSPIPALDWSKLTNADGAATQFQLTPFGQALKAMADAHNVALEIKFYPDRNYYVIGLGKAKLLFVSGLDQRNSHVYAYPKMIPNPYAFANSGNELTQFSLESVANLEEDGINAVIFEDEVLGHNREKLVYYIYKIAFPGSVYTITADHYLNPANGLQILDSKSNPQAKQILETFYKANSINSTLIPGTEYFGFSVSQFSGQQFGGFGGGNAFGGFGNGFGQPGFGNGFGQPGFGGGFGMPQQNQFSMNGGFNIGAQQPQQQVIGVVKYQVLTDEATKRTVARIYDVVELCHVSVENFLKFAATFLESMQYVVELDLDLSKLTKNVARDVAKYFAPANQMYGEPRFNGLISYVHPEAEFKRISPAYLNRTTFLKLHPEHEKDAKFPKTVSDYESKAKFAQYIAKAGYIQILSVGSMRFSFQMGAGQFVMNELNMRRYALSLGKTYEQLVEEQKAAQASGQPVQTQAAPNAFSAGPQFGFGGGMQGGFGGQQFGNPMMGGGFGGYGSQFGYGNPMMGGGFGGYQMSGMQNGHQAKGGDKKGQGGQAMQGNPYMMGGQQFGNPMMGMNGYGPQFGNPQMMGGYNPQMMGMMNGYGMGGVAGGAFPAVGAPMMAAGEGGYIPS